MAYAELETIKKVLSDGLATYPDDVSLELEWAATEINSKLAGRYELPFDDVDKYPTGVPSLIKWITSYLVGYKIWDYRTILEGTIEDTAAARWKAMADLMLDELKAGDRSLTTDLGEEINPIGSATAPRFYPSGVRAKAPSSDNDPYFVRTQAGEW